MFCFFNDTATTEIYTLSLHDALPIYTALAYWDYLARIRRLAISREAENRAVRLVEETRRLIAADQVPAAEIQLVSARSEEHTSELQSRRDLVCRLLLEKKKKKRDNVE